MRCGVDDGEIVFRDYRIDEPCEFAAPPAEVMAELRRLLPPVEVPVVERAA
jgi:hypothetical protein